MSQKSILEQALLQVQNLEDAVKVNAKGILESTMKQEFKDLLKEDIEEEEEFTEDDETSDDDINPDEEDTDDMTDDETDDDSDSENDDDLDNTEDEDSEEEPEIDDETSFDEDDSDEYEDDSDDEESEDDVMDMTGASHDEVLKIFKAMKPEDGIVVKKDGNKIEFNDGEDDYIIKLDDEDGDNDSFDQDMAENEGPYSKSVGKPKMRTGTPINENGAPLTKKPSKKLKSEPGKSIAMDENDGPYTKKVGTPKSRHAVSVDENDGPYTKKPSKKIKSEPGKSIAMDETDEENVYEIELDDKSDKKRIKGDQTEAARTFGTGVRGPAQKLKYKTGRHNMNEEVEKLRKQNGEYRKALILFKDKLNDVAIFNSNLAHMTRLFTEQTTTKKEKLEIIKRFDNVSNMNESVNLYKTIESELGNKQPLTETIANKIAVTPTTSSTNVLSEAKAYENPQFKRMKELMGKLK